MERYICIHCHFYQPQRENPWLEAIELQDSAYPYHDWNERVMAECYAPNSASRILDGQGRILKIVNNYSDISFNFGPTLLAWLEANAPALYRAILRADQESLERFSGHGSAMAQGFHHAILPLANSRDKRTEIVWGIKDFESRFGRKPEGMWLPEAAVDLESLDILAAEGLNFTVLSPYSASQVRAIGSRNWRDISGGSIDPSRPYRIALPSGRTFTLFFYDGPVSQSVAFENVLVRGEYLANRIAGAFSDARNWPQLVHIATDGETYGHHKRHGEMALAYALEHIKQNGIATLTNYGEYLERHPPTHEVKIFEGSSWSCVHGVGRWSTDCGCNSGGWPAWNQSWRGPLRDALNWLRDSLAAAYEQEASSCLRDPWAARDDYIKVILDRTPENIDRYVALHATRELNDNEKIKLIKLLEMQRHSLLSFTSCGWFFDELSGIETVQVMQYAARALQLAHDLFGTDREPEFLERLSQAKSNIPELGDGRQVYTRFVRPAIVDLSKVAAHYAVSSLFEEYPEKTRVYCYTVTREDHRLLKQGRARLAIGRAHIRSNISGGEEVVSYGVLHLGEQNLSGGIREYRGAHAYNELVARITESFEAGDFPEVNRMVFQNFDPGTYTLKLLFRDEQRKILRIIMEATLANAEAVYRTLHESQAPLIQFVKALGVPLPNRFALAAEFVLNTDLRRLFDGDEVDVERARALLEEVSRSGINLDVQTLEFALRKSIERAAHGVDSEPDRLDLLERFERALDLAHFVPFDVDLWIAQNVYHDVWRRVYQSKAACAARGDESCVAWLRSFRSIGDKLSFRLIHG